MNGIAEVLRAALKQHSRLLTKRELAEAISVLREFVKPSEKLKDEPSRDLEWLYFEYRRAKAVEHNLLKERAIRRKRLKKDPSKSNELRLNQAHERIRSLEIVIRELVGAIPGFEYLYREYCESPSPTEPSLLAAIVKAANLAPGELAHLRQEAVLESESAREAEAVCRALATYFALLGSVPLLGSEGLPSEAKTRLTNWRKIQLQLVAARQHGQGQEAS